MIRNLNLGTPPSADELREMRLRAEAEAEDAEELSVGRCAAHGPYHGWVRCPACHPPRPPEVIPETEVRPPSAAGAASAAERSRRHRERRRQRAQQSKQGAIP